MNRLRLSAAYVAILLVGLLVFGAAAVVAIDRTQRSTLDARLATAARASATFVDISHNAIHIDADDRRQFLTVLGTDTDGAVFDTQGRVLLSSAARVPQAIAPRATAMPLFIDAGQRDAAIRAYSWPVLDKGKVVGTVFVWRNSDWIDETDRGVGVAFAAAALAIAALALLAGNVVTHRALEDAFGRQRRFTADASHELRAPLAVIRAEADLALRKDREPAAYRTAMETIAAEADHLEALIGDLLSAARAESGKQTRDRIDVSQLLPRVGERLASAAAAKDASIAVQCEKDAVILADARALERALLAVGHNAVRYVPPQGVVALEARHVDRSVEIVIADGGPGFSAEALRHGLDRFWREPDAQSGSGLGLAITRSIVEADGGTIVLENKPGGGAAVRLRFPAA